MWNLKLAPGPGYDVIWNLDRNWVLHTYRADTSMLVHHRDLHVARIKKSYSLFCISSDSAVTCPEWPKSSECSAWASHSNAEMVPKKKTSYLSCKIISSQYFYLKVRDLIYYWGKIYYYKPRITSWCMMYKYSNIKMAGIICQWHFLTSDEH